MRSVTTGLVIAVAMALLVDVAPAQPPDGQRAGPPRLPMMAALDADNDGQLSAAEIENAPKALTKLDKNNDGKLTRDEIQPAPGRFGGPGMGDPGAGGPGGGFRGGQGWPGPGGSDVSSLESSPIPKDDAEKKILDVLDDMDRNQRRGMMNVPKADGRLLRLLTESLGAKHVVEIGTSNGYSGIWFCLALRTTDGKLTTYEINAQRAALARENFKRAGVEGLVTLVEGDAHQQVAEMKEPIDVLFLDADKQGYIDYLNKLLPLVQPGGLILAHNMNPRMADPRYVKAITTNPELETIFLHMQAAGVSVSMKKR